MQSDGNKRDVLMKRLVHSYSSHYNIEKLPDGSPKELAAFCVLDMTQCSYVLSKKNVLWSANSHEYSYLFSVEHLTKADFERFLSFMKRDGIPRIEVKSGHMCTALTMVILCDSAEKDALQAVKRCRLHKSFRLSFYGWMDGRTALAELSTGRVITNLSGHDNTTILKDLLLSGQKDSLHPLS